MKLLSRQELGSATGQVYRSLSSWLVSLAVLTFFYGLVVWFPNKILFQLLSRSYDNWWQKPQLITDGISILLSQNGKFNGWLLILLGLLSAFNLAISSYLWKKSKDTNLGGSVAGSAFSVLSAGCAACGSALLASFVGASTSLAWLGFLPGQGREFAWIALIVLIPNTYFLLGKVLTVGQCLIKKKL